MSTTLTNGLKLPDKGSVDWYADMQNNYQILDGAVGTIAEHTTQIAGKAPLVHTHTKSDITDFPAYGTTAGTICEGNDSRLSDARTPVAHTHLTADVTDLLNSAHTWTASQTLASNSFLTTYGYRFRIKNDSMVLGTVPSSNQWTGMQFVDKNDTPISEIVQSLQSNGNSLYQINVFPNEANSQKRSLLAYTYSSTNNNNGVAFSSNVVPQNTNTYDLGSSSYQWNNLYAKKVNTDTVKAGTGILTLQSNGTNNSITIYNGNSSSDGAGLFLYGKDHSNGSLCRLQIYNTNVPRYEAIDFANSTFYSFVDKQINLGDSTHRWKTLNGINPGALSLPDTLGTSGTENVNYFNVIGYLNNTGTLATIPSTATYDGWLYINAKDGTDSYIIIDDSPASFGTSVFGNNGLGAQGIGLLCLMCPIRKGHAYNVRIKSAGIVSARIYPAQGNV